MSSAASATDNRRNDYSTGELIADAALHAAAIVAAGAAVVALLQSAAGAVPARLAAASVYAVALLGMPILSAAYNLGPTPGWRRLMRPIDQAWIFVLIAGTYTPFAVVALGGRTGFALLALVWAVAAVGVFLKLQRPHRLDGTLSVTVYLALGWCALPALGPLLAAVETPTLALVGIGGLIYTLGVPFHLWTTLRYHNVIWHAFVVVAAGVHVVAVSRVLAS